jgi:hypothetical protein
MRIYTQFSGEFEKEKVAIHGYLNFHTDREFINCVRAGITAAENRGAYEVRIEFYESENEFNAGIPMALIKNSTCFPLSDIFLENVGWMMGVNEIC